jgi:hypothetical protein
MPGGETDDNPNAFIRTAFFLRYPYGKTTRPPCYDGAPAGDRIGATCSRQDRLQDLFSDLLVNTVQRTVTLMRTIKLLLLGILLFASFASHAAAQTAEPPRFFFNVNFAGQAREQTFTETSTFTIYNESGASATTHVTGGGPLFDISAGARVWGNVGVAFGYTSFSDDDDAGITVRVPHPVIIGLPREESTSAGLKHTESALHLQFLWIVPYEDQFEFAFFIGPSFFTVRQDLATVLVSDIADPPPLIRNVTTTRVKESATGINVGIDGTYLITRIPGLSSVPEKMVGVGVFLRYVGASIDLPSANGATISDDLSAGGFQAGVGLRLRF